ncbi:hypothetical protein OROHE_021689 [Orobanche hederae]
MERANSEDGNGSFKLPIGFRFHPTDEELLVHYLKRKVFSLPLPAAVVPDFDVFQFSPWDMPGELKEKRYFFSKRKMDLMNKSRLDHHFSTDSDGYWRATTNNNKDSKQILAPGSNFVIGIKRSYVFFHQGKKSLGLVKTPWIMHEFCLVGSISPTPYSPQKIMIQVGDWVVCRVYQRKRKRRNQGRVDRVVAGGKKSQNLGISFDKRNSAASLSSSSSPPSSSFCSGITEISSDNDEFRSGTGSI